MEEAIEELKMTSKVMHFFCLSVGKYRPNPTKVYLSNQGNLC